MTSILFIIILLLFPAQLMAATIVNDTFTDTAGTALASHTGETGATWTVHPSYASGAVITTSPANKVKFGSGNNAGYYASGTPGSADYTVKATYTIGSGGIDTGGNAYFGVTGRMSTSADTYYWGAWYAGTWYITKVLSGSLTFLNTTSSGTLTAGNTYDLELVMSGTGLTLKVNGSTVLTATDSDISSAGKSGFYNRDNQTTDSLSFLMDSFLVTDSSDSATSATLTGPTSGYNGVASTNFTVTLDGTYTGTITPSDSSGGGSFTPSSLSYTSESTTKTFTYTPGSVGSKTISISPSPSLTTPTTVTYVVTDAPTTIAINNAAIFYSPWNWRLSGSTYAVANATGAYFRVNFTGTKFIINVDTSAMSTDYPKLAYSIDGGAYSYVTMTSASSIDLTPTPLSSGTHSIQVIMAGQGFTDKWTPVDQLKITSILIDASSSVSSPTLKTKRMAVFSDSIGESALTLDTTAIAANSQWTTSWNKYVADDLDAEIGNISYSGQGFNTSLYGVPSLPNSYNYVSSGQSRTFTTVDYIILHEGTNDSGDTQADVTDMLTNLRTAAPTAKIYLMVPFNQTNASMFQSAYDAQSDPDVYFIDLGSAGASIVTDNSTDGVHPTPTGHALLSDYITSAIQSTLSSSSVSTRLSGTNRAQGNFILR